VGTPQEWQAAVPGVDRLRLEAPARASQRSHEAATQREPDSGTHHSLRGKTRAGRGLTRVGSVVGGPGAVTLPPRAGGNKRAPLRGLGVSLCMGVSLAALAAGQLLTVGSPGPSRRSHRARVTSTPSRHGALSQEPPRQPCVASASVSSRRWVACSAPTCWCMRSATVESTVRTRSLVSVRGYGTWFFPIEEQL
jgi:hypothetical protein